MRKLISFLLLLVLAFNWLGFDLVIALVNHGINTSTQHRIDEGKYDRTTLVEIKVELNLPYTTDWKDFQQAKGSFVQNGVVYNFVERKFEKGYMIYRCLPNEKGTALNQAEKQYFADAHDIEKPEGQQKKGGQKSNHKKWNLETQVSSLTNEKDDCYNLVAICNPLLTIAAKDGFGFLPAQPPEV